MTKRIWKKTFDSVIHSAFPQKWLSGFIKKITKQNRLTLYTFSLVKFI